MTYASSSWRESAQLWPHAYGSPQLSGVVKHRPEDFQVTEQFSFKPSGEGEHVWLRIRKCKANTAQVAKSLARYAGVSYRDVSYSGLKDFFAVTEQWFSVHLPEQKVIDWPTFGSENVTVLEFERHHKKLRRGSHIGNRFELLIRQIHGDRDQFLQRWALCRDSGVPNYFGSQRFGRHFGNMHQAVELLVKDKRIKDRTTRGLILSAARSWLFNECLANRVQTQTWQHLHESEPAVLQGSESFFITQKEPGLQSRLNQLDIHPSSPLWGDVDDVLLGQFQQLHEQEMSIISRFREIADGLVSARLSYGRRATRSAMLDAEMAFEGNQLLLSFNLQKGQFATTVLRELLLEREYV